MANEINLKIKVGDDGTLKIVGKEADKAAKSTDNLGKSTDKLNRTRDKTHRQEKSLHQSGLSGAKAFSKQAQTINGGSSSLVGAYAVLAANIFALTAAFGALQRAAQVEQLEQGLRSLGTASGIAMQNLAEGLQETTGHALSLADAMRATALASSAGFDSSSIERLGDVARKASIALGRDTADSLNRLTKGAIKLEPELLDELGIMVRLDEATENYARALGKNANELTTFQKRQAFMNAVLEEGEAKFAAMGDVDTNPFDKLSATFQDLTKTLINILNVGILPVVNFFAGSQAALFGAMIMFGRTIATAMIPALGNLGAKYTEVARASAAASLQQLKSLKNIEGGGANLKKLAQAYDPAIDGQDGLNKMMKTAQNSLASNEAGLKRIGKELGENSEKYAEKKLKVEASKNAIETLTQFQKDFNNTTTEDAKATAVASAAQGNYRQALDELGIAKQKMTKESKKATAGATRFGKVAGFVSLQAAKAAINVKVLGIAFLNMIPLIGQIIAVVGVVISVLGTMMEKFKSEGTKEFEKNLEGIRERADELAESLKEVQKSLSGQESSIKGASAQYTALSNALGTFADDVATLKDSEDGGFFSLFRGEAAGYNEIIDTLANTTPEYKKQLTAMAIEMGLSTSQMAQLTRNGIQGVFMTREFAKTLLEKFLPQAKRFPDAVKNMATSVKENSTAISDFINKEQIKTSVDEVLAAFTDIDKSFVDLQKNTEEESKKFFEAFKEKASDDLVGIIKLDELMEQSKDAKGVVQFSTLNQLIDDALESEKETLRTRQKQERLAKITVATAKAEIGLLKQQKILQGAAVQVLREEQKIRDTQVDALDTQIADVQRMIDLGKDTEDNEEKITSLRRQRAILVQQENTFAKEMVAQNQEQLRILEHQQKARREALSVLGQMNTMQNSLLDAKQASLEADIEAQNRADPSRGYKGALNAADKLKALNSDVGKVLEIDEKGVLKQSEETKTMLEAREIAIENELHMTKLKNEMDRKVLQFRLRVIDAELQAAHELAHGKDSGDYEGRGTLHGMMNELEDGGTFATLQDNLSEAIAEAARKGLTNEVGRLKEQQASEIIGAEGSTSAEVIANQNEAGGIASLDKTSQKFQAMQTAIGPMVESLKQLGPEGELVASVAQGALITGEAWATAAEKIKGGAEGMEKGAAVATAIGQTMSQIGNIMNAASNARIAGIDKEIAAEKKRDGKSKESLAKIKQLEKKKEQEKRKAFERNKKMQMAQTIINTAAAIMEASPNIPMMILMGIMGAAQLAVISGTSYQGGGSSDSGGGIPSSVALGKRTEKSDLSKSQSARGELAYFRGDQGIGGPENFRPAFGGRKHYATGGNMGYVVGEQGPELFMPERPGTIVPADDTAAAMGGTTNVTFSINAIDASGVEEVLAQQQGNIIGMIRTAANSYGEEFMEDLDETTYTAPVARRA